MAMGGIDGIGSIAPGAAIIAAAGPHENRGKPEQGALAQGRLFGAFDATSPIFALIGADGSVLHVSDLTRELLDLGTNRLMDAITGLLETIRGETAPAHRLDWAAERKRSAGSSEEDR